MNQLGDISLVITLLFRLIAAVLFTAVVFKTLAELEVKNGLVILRKQLFFLSLFLFIINAATIFLLVLRRFDTFFKFQYYPDVINILNASGLLAIGYILYKIFTQQYSPEQIERHKKISELENESER